MPQENQTLIGKDQMATIEREELRLWRAEALAAYPAIRTNDQRRILRLIREIRAMQRRLRRYP